MNIIQKLLEIKAIKLSPDNQFTLSSGAKSPIYCDNRLILSFPKFRSFVADEFINIIKEKYPQVETIAGVATGAIGMGMLVAEKMGLPFIYVRPEPKKHGRQNQIEGFAEKKSKVVVIEDLISTGGSSLNAIKALNDGDLDVLGLIAIFTYGFEKSELAFLESGCKKDTLTNYDEMVKYVRNEKLFSESDIEILENWKSNGI